MLLIRRFAAALTTASPQHVDQSVVGDFQFHHPLTQRFAVVRDNARGVGQSFIIEAKSLELSQDAVLGCTQRREFARQRLVAFLALS